MNPLPYLTALACLSLGLCFTPAHAAEAGPEANPAGTAELSQLAFLAGGEWEAKLPASPDGKAMSIRARFSWAENHRAIRISNAWVMDGKPSPYLDGLYTWHPGKKAIVFWYTDAQGGVYEGTVVRDAGALVHDFQITEATGHAKTYVARMTPDGADAWGNEILERQAGKLQPLVKVRYERVKVR